MEDSTQLGKIEGEPKDLQEDIGNWFLELSSAKKDREGFLKRAELALRRYRDAREVGQGDTLVNERDKRYNVYWANIEVLKPALYARVPKPVVERRFKDQDPIGRVASQVLERSTTTALSLYDFNAVMILGRNDYLVPGRGQAWIRYVPEFIVDSVTGQEMLKSEKVVAEYVHWNDFLNSPARTWGEVRWVARRSYLTRTELIERFGEEIGRDVPLDYTPNHLRDTLKDDAYSTSALKRAAVWEVWDKKKKEVLWLSEGYKQSFLDRKPDLLNLKDFFPCPEPLDATRTSESVWPICDYWMYRDQLVELDIITERISLLTGALRVSGVYDASFQGLDRILSENLKNDLIPIPNWATFAGVGGFTGVMQFMPIKEIAEVLMQLYKAKDAVLAEIYQITGMSDIIRGFSSPSETATAQQIKGQFATLRLSDRQANVQRWGRDLIAMHAEIISEKFSPETIAEMAGLDLLSPDVAQVFPQVIELLRNDFTRTYRVDIETDSMVAVDENQEKQSRIEFLSAVGNFFNQALPLLQSFPPLAAAIGEMLMFVVRGFRTGRGLESVIESSMSNLVQQAMQPPPPPEEQAPDPKFAELELKKQVEEARMQLEQAKLQLEQQRVQNEQLKIQVDAKRIDTEAMLKTQEQQGRMQLEVEKARAELALRSQEIQNQNNAETIRDLQGGKNSMPPLEINLNMSNQKRKFAFVTDPATGTRIAQDITEESAV